MASSFIPARVGRITAMLLAAALCACMLVTAAGCATSMVTTTTQGKVQGLATANGVVAFKGIPYAAPPVGDLRFQPPQPAKPWTGTLKAFDYGSAEMQAANAITGSPGAPESEDCLFLNVWTPRLDKGRRPAMVWIHGGGFKNGSGSDPIYDGAKLAGRGNVDVVTLNYRLGPFGFLYLGGLGGQDYAQSGNLGLLDQIAAIKWVRDNISSFGGDPSNVTVFGESAGGMSVCTLLGMPAAKGLFRRAIAESGAANTVRDTTAAAAVTSKFMKTAGVSDINGLLALSARQLVNAESSMISQGAQSQLVFGPVIDGSALPQPPLHAIAAGSAAGVDLMIGTNLNEMRLWILGVPALARLPLGVVAGSIPTAQQAMDATSLGSSGAVAASYQSRRPGATDGDVSLAVLTDEVFRVPAVRVAEAQSSLRKNTWMYLFTWPSPTFAVLGACHAIELPFVFGNIEGRASRLVGKNPPRKLSEAMQDAWTAFARTGNPNGSGVPAWSAYDSTTRSTMVFNTGSAQQNDPYGQDREVWQGVPFDGVLPAI